VIVIIYNLSDCYYYREAINISGIKGEGLDIVIRHEKGEEII